MADLVNCTLKKSGLEVEVDGVEDEAEFEDEDEDEAEDEEVDAERAAVLAAVARLRLKSIMAGKVSVVIYRLE